jgi:hypothetical protein
VNARERKMRSRLDPRSMTSCLRAVLPRRSGYRPVDCESLIAEAERFGIRTPRQFRKLLLRHRKALIEDDRSALLDSTYLRALREDMGRDAIADMLRRQRCFAWEALVRTAYEREFGEAYEDFARQRDQL